MLSNAGYDVWMGNSRGNTYSKAHVNFTASSSKFWEFSWHEMGVYDLPTTINYIINATGQKQIHYVGHSQGCSIFFVMLSEKPEFNQLIEKAALFAPVANTTNARSPIIGVFSKISMPLYVSSYSFLLFNSYSKLYSPWNVLFTCRYSYPKTIRASLK
jgi:lysosomal acid lipase/cholesteryl ester hydrolase